jgi:hypothetical protein
LHAFGASGDHGVVADITELVDASIPGDVDVVTDVDVTGDG